MSTLGAGPRHRDAGRRTRRRGSRRALGWALRLLALLVAFWLGVALGKAIAERPKPGGTQTLVRTLKARTVPAATRTVTVTVTGP